jgi:hypothetical protein
MKAFQRYQKCTSISLGFSIFIPKIMHHICKHYETTLLHMYSLMIFQGTKTQWEMMWCGRSQHEKTNKL